MPERGVDTAPLTFYLSEESRVGLLHTPTRVPLSLSLSLDPRLASSHSPFLSFYPLSLSLSLSGYSGKSMFLRYFLFPSGACKTRVTGCGYLSSLPSLLPSRFVQERELPLPIELANLCGSPRDRGGILARDEKKGMTKEGKGSSRREGRKTVKREGKRIRSRRAAITIEEEEKGERERRRRRRRGRERDRRREGKRRREREEREEGSGRTDRLLLPPHPNFNQDPKYASRMDACEHSRRYYRALRCM